MADMPTASQIAANTRTWQTWLNSARNPRTARPLVVDGKWGTLTDAAYYAWIQWFNRAPAQAQGSNGPFNGYRPLAIVWKNAAPIPAPTPPGPPPHPDPLPPAPGESDRREKLPIWQEPWFWFTAAAALVLISAFLSKKKR